MSLALRFGVTSLIRGHWKTLTLRDPDAGEQEAYPPDLWTRSVVALVPAIAAIAGATFTQDTGLMQVDASWVGVVIAAAALLSAALLGAFSLLGQWRARLNQRAHDSSAYAKKEWPLRALIDEAVATTLMGVLDSAVIMALALIAAAASGWVALALVGLTVGVGVHLGLLFVLLVVCLYSAYTQSEEVPESLDCHFRTAPLR